MKKIRTRYAPSPTGYLHIGGARAALFSYLFAKHNSGEFIVRIEDTDQAREVVGGVDSQLDNLSWLGIFPDESPRSPGKYGPYIQSQKLERYKKLAHELVLVNKAYFCFCTEKDLAESTSDAVSQGSTQRYSRRCLNLTTDQISKAKIINPNPAIRIKIDDSKKYEWNDLIRSEISVPGDSMSDLTILKGNGYPTYNFAVVIDDHDMEISHILRGEEHISNTPYQIAIKQALEFNELIHYGHSSLITNEEGKKLSKRDTSVKQFVGDYKELGYLPAAVLNYLCLLGWSHPENKEIFELREAELKFDLSRVSKSPTTFDLKKLEWVCSSYFKQMSNDEYLKFVTQFVKISNRSSEWVNQFCLVVKNQISFASQINLMYIDTFENPLEFSSEQKNLLNSSNSLAVLKEFHSLLSNLQQWDVPSISQQIKSVQTKTGLKGKDLFFPIRLAISKQDHGPDLATITFLIGKQKCLESLGVYVK